MTPPHYALHGGTIDASAAASLVLLMSSPDPGKRDAAARALHGGTIDSIGCRVAGLA